MFNIRRFLKSHKTYNSGMIFENISYFTYFMEHTVLPSKSTIRVCIHVSIYS